MPRGRRDAQLLAQFAVVAMCLVSVGAALASDLRSPPGPPPGSGVVKVQNVSWALGWAPGYYSPTLHTGALSDNCTTFTGEFSTSSRVWCLFVHNEFIQLGGPNDSVEYYVWASEIVVDPPFSMIGGIGHPALLCGPDCDAYGITIQMPAKAGAYNLTGAVYFSWTA